MAVIDESKGGDAIVAWKDKVGSLDALKAARRRRPSRSRPASPSEHLLRSAAVHFDVPALRGQGRRGAIETNGSPEALKRLLDRKVDAAVVWEPDVTRALATAGVVKLLSTAETQRLIIDVLVASRTVLQQDPEMIKALLVTYFDVVRHYREQPDKLASDVAAETKVPMAQVKPMLAGVAWAGLTDNFEVWLGTTPDTNGMVGRDPLDAAHPDRDRRAARRSAARPGSVPHHQQPASSAPRSPRPPPADSPAATAPLRALDQHFSELPTPNGSGCAKSARSRRSTSASRAAPRT